MSIVIEYLDSIITGIDDILKRYDIEEANYIKQIDDIKIKRDEKLKRRKEIILAIKKLEESYNETVE